MRSEKPGPPEAGFESPLDTHNLNVPQGRRGGWVGLDDRPYLHSRRGHEKKKKKMASSPPCCAADTIHTLVGGGRKGKKLKDSLGPTTHRWVAEFGDFGKEPLSDRDTGSWDGEGGKLVACCERRRYC